MLQRFYNLCRKPIIEVDSTSMIETSENILRRTYRKRTDGHIDFQIDALILPDDMVWPSFLSKARCRFHHIYFQRQSVLDANRRKITLKRICNRSQVVWSGAPGIRKSSETNYIFMELLRHLGEDGWPSMVAFHTRYNIFTFTTAGVQRIRINFSDLLEFSQKHAHDGSVLILELEYYENNPVIVMPFLTAVPTMDLRTKFKFFMKARGGIFMLISPPDVEEVCLMTEAIMDICPNNDIFINQSKKDAIDIIRTRAMKVGAVPLNLFCKEETFQIHVKRMKQFSNALNSCLDSLNIFHVPREAQLLVAPFLRYGVTDPTIALSYEEAAQDYFASLAKEDPTVVASLGSSYSFEFRYLTDYAKLLHIEEVRTCQDIKSMISLGFDYQLSDINIRLQGKLSPQLFQDFDDGYNNCDHWEWHKDVGPRTELSYESKVSRDQTPVLPRCLKEISFKGMYFKGSVSDIEPNVLYRSISRTMAWCEQFTVDHANKTIYFYQINSINLSNHVFSISTIRNIMTNLGMFKEHNLGYNMTLLCFCDWSQVKSHGAEFQNKEEDGHFSLDELRAKGDEVAARLNVYVVRAYLFPFPQKHLLSFFFRRSIY